MSNFIYNEYYIDLPTENIIDPFSITSNNTSEEMLYFPDQTNNYQQIQITPSTPNLWRPNQSFQRIYSKFQSTFLKEYPNTPCVYCGKLLYKDKAIWIQYSTSSDPYPIEESNEISVLTYTTIKYGILKIPTCFLVHNQEIDYNFQY